MPQKQLADLRDFYNMLLEAERAGVKVISDLIYLTEEQRLRACLKKFLRDEGMNCHILASLIHDLDAKPTDKTGTFVEKVQALKTLEEKIELLIRGQSWVARKIQEFGHLVPEGSKNLFLNAIKLQHEENVDTLKRYLSD